MGKALFAYPSENAAATATLSMTNENATYPATKGNNLDPADPLKATATSTVITITLSGSTTLKGFALINTNLAGATCTLTNTASYSQVITTPARTADGNCVHGWRDMRSDANPTATVWTLTITGASANVAIGEIVAVTNLRDLNWRWQTGGPELAHAWDAIIHRTFYGSRLKYNKRILIRSGRGTAVRDTDRSTLLGLAQACQSSSYDNANGEVPFLFIPDSAVNDAWFVHLTDSSLRWIKVQQNSSDTSIDLTEVSSGLVL
jgi:hypothetical protein